MSSSNVFQQLASGMANSPMNNPMGGMTQMMQAFRQFKQAMQGKDPEKMVMQMLSSGQMTQEQLKELQAMASSLQSLLK